jgi:spermidine/putrescine-binding protein
LELIQREQKIDDEDSHQHAAHFMESFVMNFLKFSCSMILCLVCLTVHATTIRVLQWDGYIPKDKADEFSRKIKAETGEIVDFTFENIVDEKMEFDRIRSGKADLVFPGVDIMDDASYDFKRKKMLMEIDPARLKNYEALLPQFRAPKHLMYLGKMYGIAFAAGETAIAYNASKIKPKTIYDLLVPQNAGKLGTLDFSPHVHEVLALALGYPVADITNYGKLSTDREYLSVLQKWGGLATVYFKDGVDNAEQAKDLVAYIGWGFAIRTLQLQYDQNWKIMPLPGGTLVWTDSMVIPKQVENDPIKAAILYKLMDFLISKEYQKEVVLNEISCLPVNDQVLRDLKPQERRGLDHIFDLRNKKDIIFLPSIDNIRNRNGLQRLWGQAKSGSVKRP